MKTLRRPAALQAAYERLKDAPMEPQQRERLAAITREYEFTHEGKNK